MLKHMTDVVVKAALAMVGTRVSKIVKIDAGNATACKVDIDVRALRVADFPSSVTVFDETEPVEIEPGRYAVVAVFVKLP